MNRLTDRVAIVTGAASGIGRGTTLRLLAEGATVFAVDVNGQALEALHADDVVDAEAKARLHSQVIDISDERSVKEGVARIVESAGRLDILVNAAGILTAGHTHEFTLDAWNRIIQINLTGTFLMVRETLPLLLESAHGGRVVNFSSTSAFFAHPYMAAYSATKGAITSFTHSIALEYAGRGLRAVNIVPGGIESGITAATPGLLPADADYSLLAKLSAALKTDGGLGAPSDVAAVIATLVSDDGAFITGTEIRIDGGAHM
ncbi:SDR family NAD(P)-dependent oxidoreductase [Microbacterium sp. Mcb102]|uniref:SDR family NAD(P)-dependent oxidoreductase n=1 Tax=Microbacterium sp. Mcb102 TaxID=2926012 RepID=UPI0021C645C9|nr:SDR family NAD(P)-dependent oxidoreductase [Microbacterium sp. Mcb102]